MRVTIALIAISAVLSLSSISHAVGPYEALSVVRQEKKASPEFSLPQGNGETVRLSDFRGKVVLLGFFKTF